MITLYWWMLPLFITLSTVGYAIYDFGTATGYYGGIKGWFVFFIGLCISGGIIVGHFL